MFIPDTKIENGLMRVTKTHSFTLQKNLHTLEKYKKYINPIKITS